MATPSTGSARLPASVLLSASNVETETPAAVLGLDGADLETAERLTVELRSAFARRGLSGGEPLSLAEVRLTMGCEGLADHGCLAQAGASLGVERLIYGALDPNADGYRLTLTVLDVDQGIAEAGTERTVTKQQLAPANIVATATAIVDSLFPSEEPSSLDPEPIPDGAGIEPKEDDTQLRSSTDDSNFVWGPYRPRPTWKKVGLGISLGLFVVGGLGLIASGVAVKHYERKAERAALASLNDCVEQVIVDGVPTARAVPCEDPDEPRFTDNDVHGDYCEAAGVKPFANEPFDPADPDKQKRVVNKRVHDACLNGDVAETLSFAAGGVLAAGAVFTILFTTLMYVHRKKPSARALRQRNFQVRGGPLPEGGFSMGGGFRF